MPRGAADACSLYGSGLSTLVVRIFADPQRVSKCPLTFHNESTRLNRYFLWCTQV